MEGLKKVHLGAGKDTKPGFVNIDSTAFPGIDIVCDITKGIPLPDNSADYVYSQDFLEHIPPESKVFVINEIWRILCDKGIMEHYVPNAGSRNDYGSPSHLSHWNLQQFDHFNVDSYRYEKDKDYEGTKGGFRTIKSEEVTPLLEDQGYKFQSIHIIMEAIKDDK